MKEMYTESGDVYGKEDGTDKEIGQYRAAVNIGDWKYVLDFEEGKTGWRFIRSG